MSYHRKVIYASLAALLGVTLLVLLAELLDGGKVDGMSVGLIALAFSLFEAMALLITALVIAIFGPDQKTVRQTRHEDVLDSKDSYERSLTKRQRAGAFLAAAGLVLLVGGSLCFGSLGLGGGGLDFR